MDFTVNVWAVLVAAVVYFGLGSGWYGVLSKPWMAAAGMGVALWFGADALEAFLGDTLLVSLAALLALIGFGVVAFFFLCQITGAIRLGDLRRAFTRG